MLMTMMALARANRRALCDLPSARPLQFSIREKELPGGAIKWRKVQIRPL